MIEKENSELSCVAFSLKKFIEFPIKWIIQCTAQSFTLWKNFALCSYSRHPYWCYHAADFHFQLELANPANLFINLAIKAQVFSSSFNCSYKNVHITIGVSWEWCSSATLVGGKEVWVTWSCSLLMSSILFMLGVPDVLFSSLDGFSLSTCITCNFWQDPTYNGWFQISQKNLRMEICL